MPKAAVEFLAILLTALTLIPGGAHILALPNKIRLPQERYFAAQQVYRGWAYLGVLAIAAIATDLYLAYSQRDNLAASRLGLAGGLCLVVTLLVFFLWVWPANRATDNWISTPPDWSARRARWEFGHAANAVLSLAALCLVIASVLASRPIA